MGAWQYHSKIAGKSTLVRKLRHAQVAGALEDRLSLLTINKWGYVAYHDHICTSAAVHPGSPNTEQQKLTSWSNIFLKYAPKKGSMHVGPLNPLKLCPTSIFGVLRTRNGGVLGLKKCAKIP